MSLHGLKKAVARLPQQVTSSGSTIPEDLQVLEKQLTAGEKSLDVIISQTKSYADALTGLLDSSVGLLASYEKDTSALSAARLQLLNHAEANKHRIIKPCRNMKEHLSTVRKVVAKRDRKKIDFDRFTAALRKQETVAPAVKAAPGHQAKIEEATKDLNNSTLEYEKENQVLREQLPKVLVVLRKFFTSMIEQEHGFQAETLKLLKDFYEALAQTSKIADTEKSLQTQAIVENWRSQYTECKQAVEDHLEIIRSSRIPAMTMAQTGKSDMQSPAQTAYHSGQPGSSTSHSKPALPVRPGGAADQDLPPAYDGPYKPVPDQKG